MFKLDLHRHLEGSHSADALLAVAEIHGLKAPLFWNATEGRYRRPDELQPELTMAGPSDDALAFYRCIQLARAAYVSEAAIADLAYRAFVEATADTDGVEMRASLFSMTRTLLEHEGAQWREVPPTQFAGRAESILKRVVDEMARAMADTGTPLLLRVGFSRTFESAPHYEAMAEMLRDHKDDVCGLDVLGIVVGDDKEPMPPALRNILQRLRGDFPDLTIHAGEFEDHRSVARTLALDVQGIGHGVHSVGSDDVMAQLKGAGVTLEVCPHSNHLLIPTALRRLHDLHGAHPLCTLQQHGVHCVIGSDDPTPMGTSFSEEWERASALGADMARVAADGERRWRQLGGRPI
jgi:adenosine deaminase